LIENGISSNTSILIIDHVSSSSAIVFPIQEIVTLCREKGILVLVDGAHAPGMLRLSVNDISPDWYVGNLHKWVCAPLGTAFVWTSEEWRSSTHPVTISHCLDQGYTSEFDWQGTRDITGWLASVDAINEGISIGWNSIRQHNHEFAVWMHNQLVDAWHVEPYSPLEGTLLGSMCTVQLPRGYPTSMESCIALRDHIFAEFAIEVPIFEFQGKGAIRLSAQLYSKAEHVQKLIFAFDKIGVDK
jgi:isopenicillin-N epimerase